MMSSGETNVSTTAVGTVLGSMGAVLKSTIELGVTMQTIFYAAIGAVVGFVITEALKYLKKKYIDK